jgi:hypothetical protein
MKAASIIADVQRLERERRKRDQRPSSRIDDRARIGVEDPAAHLDR